MLRFFSLRFCFVVTCSLCFSVLCCFFVLQQINCGAVAWQPSTRDNQKYMLVLSSFSPSLPPSLPPCLPPALISLLSALLPTCILGIYLFIHVLLISCSLRTPLTFADSPTSTSQPLPTCLPTNLYRLTYRPAFTDLPTNRPIDRPTYLSACPPYPTLPTYLPTYLLTDRSTYRHSGAQSSYLPGLCYYPLAEPYPVP